MRPTAPNSTDPVAWNAYLAEGNATQARKRVAADVLLRDPGGRVLLVNPTYKPGWDLPGGMAEENEPPHEAAARELHEELGLEISPRVLLVVDWVPPHGPWDDQIAFIFDGGTLGHEEAEGLRPHDAELSEIMFVAPDKAAAFLQDRLCRRFDAAMRAASAGIPAYLHDGVTVM
ncbi:NUDIX domain-containing protein [Streptomyces sp. SCSIO 30461]|uniref:NUDIX domain-containing protein n=1 Tax=Streptomyces sp. SCSIO 30461 TaxID=3118085 RepID=UPI0030CF7082